MGYEPGSLGEKIKKELYLETKVFQTRKYYFHIMIKNWKNSGNY